MKKMKEEGEKKERKRPITNHLCKHKKRRIATMTTTTTTITETAAVGNKERRNKEIQAPGESF